MSSQFFTAIKKGDQVKVEEMLASDPTLTRSRDKDGLSPIMVAVNHGQVAIADLLVNHTVTITIFEAAATGKLQQIMLMLAKDPGLANVFDDNGYQPLHLAAKFGHLDVVNFLLNAGAWVNSASVNKLRATPLLSAVAGGYVDVAYRLLDAGADPNARQSGDNSPLHISAQNGQVEMVRLLLDYGANLEVKNMDRKTPLDLASEKGFTEMAMLLKSGVTKRFRKPRDLV
ncbi:MAG: ankyrin repeat domain-containing protein [Anaerolineales bacterium]|jgi:ankyrin repeat protein